MARVKYARCGVLFTPTRTVPLSCAKPTTTENVTTPDGANGTTRSRLIGPKPVVEAFLQEAEEGTPNWIHRCARTGKTAVPSGADVSVWESINDAQDQVTTLLSAARNLRS